jgi:radical SAM superfamily enzyme YgiQ (UPF0313 family)
VKALLINPPTPPSFWSFNEDCWLSGTKTLVPPLGLITMAALLPGAWELRLADLNARPLPAGAWEWADLVMLTGMLVQREGLLDLVREAKARGKTVVVGGPYATSLPGEVLDAGADFLFQGEAENTMPLFLAALDAGKTRGTFHEPGRPKMTESPVPRFDLLRLEDYTVMSIQTSRGCPYDCEFCDVVNLYGRKPRYKKPEQVIKELAALYSLGWRENIFISDDNFIGNRKHALAILAQLVPWMKECGEPFGFWTQASVNLGQDLEMMDLMTAANFSNIFVGVESTDVEVLGLNRKYQNIRNPLAESLENMNRNGLSVVASFVLGFDGEKQGAGDRICDFVEEVNLPLVMLNLLQVMPNTSLWQRLQKEGRLRQERTTGNTVNWRLNYLPTRPEGEILGEYLQAVQRLYEPAAYLRRAFQAILHMRPSRQALKGATRKEPAATSNPDSNKQNSMLKGLAALLRLIWLQGIRAPYRGQFWKQLLVVMQKNPSRKTRYLISCGLGENLFAYRHVVRDKLASGSGNHR